RVSPVQLELGEGYPLVLLGRGQVSLVVRVRQPLAAVPRRRQRGQPGPDAGRRQVLRLAVVLVPARVLPYLGDVEITDGAYPRGKIHGADVTRAHHPRALQSRAARLRPRPGTPMIAISNHHLCPHRTPADTRTALQ